MILTNVKITKVERGKSGEGQYGPWQAWSIWIDDKDWAKIRFSYMQGENKLAPEKDMDLDILEFEKEDKYYNVKKIQPRGEKPKPEPESETSRENGDRYPRDPKAFYYSYAKDLTVELLKICPDLMHKPTGDKCDFFKISAMVVYFGEIFYRCSAGNEELLSRVKKTINPKVGEKSKKSPTPDEIPENEEGPGPDDVTPEEASKIVEEYTRHINEVDNIPHLKNWMKKAMKDQKNQDIAKLYPEFWDKVTQALNARHEEIKDVPF